MEIEKEDLNTIINPNIKIKIETPELDEEFHDALFSEENDDLTKGINLKERKVKKIIKPNIHKKIFDIKNSYRMSIYFNKTCIYGSHILKKKLDALPNSIGPGPVCTILQEAINMFINISYFPSTTLKKIKIYKKTLFDGPGGVEMLIGIK